jgi:SOS-response transcriptional repressor LexA
MTPKQMNLLDFLSRFIRKMDLRQSPRFRNTSNLSSPATVHEQLAALEREGSFAARNMSNVVSS